MRPRGISNPGHNVSHLHGVADLRAASSGVARARPEELTAELGLV